MNPQTNQLDYKPTDLELCIIIEHTVKLRKLPSAHHLKTMMVLHNIEPGYTRDTAKLCTNWLQAKLEQKIGHTIDLDLASPTAKQAYGMMCLEICREESSTHTGYNPI